MSLSSLLVKNYDVLYADKQHKTLFDSLNKKEKLLFDGLLNGESELRISKELYDASPSHQSFQSLKKKLNEKIFNNFLTHETGSSTQKFRAGLVKKVALVKILDLFGLRKLFVPISKKLYKQVLINHMYHEASELARILMVHATTYEGNEAKGKRYRENISRHLKIYEKECEVQYQYAQLQYLFFKESLSQHMDLLDNYINSIEKELDSYPSFRIHTFYHLMRYAKYYTTNDIPNRIRVSKEALSYIDALELNQSNVRNVFLFNLINSYLEQGELAKAELLLTHFLDENNYKTYQYYRYREILFRIYIYQGRQHESSEAFEYLRKNIRKMESLFTRDRLLIYELYIDILNSKQSNFRRIKYNFNKVNQDKLGLHIPFLIGQAVQTYIHDIDKFIDTYESLVQYSYRYLTGPDYDRTRAFIKAMGNMLDDKFDTELPDPYNNDRVSRSSLEIIKYEELLNILVKAHKGQAIV